jgi:hypothetical protein
MHSSVATLPCQLFQALHAALRKLFAAQLLAWAGASLIMCAGCHLLLLLLQHQVIGPDVEYVLSRAQAIQQEHSSPVLTVEHLNSALEKVQGGGGGKGGGDDQLTKAELEATMKQMLMVSLTAVVAMLWYVNSLNSSALACS